MTGLEIFLGWLCCSIISGVKQSQVSKNPASTEDTSSTIMASILGPIWLIVAIIRQVFIEKWH